MHNIVILVAVLYWFLLSIDVGAQARAIPFPSGRGQGAGGRATALPGDQSGRVAIEPLEVTRPIVGIPYKAEAITETNQSLADGNSIERRTSTMIARDGKGRVRREQQALALGALFVDVPLVTIADPAARTHVTLDRERKIAVRVTMLPDEGRSRGAAMAPAGASNGSAVKEEMLGERGIEGIRAEGTRTTMTIPANTVGNRAPITAVSERWFSPDLQAVVFTRRSDPRFGETIYRLVNIVRAEPPATLFEIPADYRIEERILRTPRSPVRE